MSDIPKTIEAIKSLSNEGFTRGYIEALDACSNTARDTGQWGLAELFHNEANRIRKENNISELVTQQ